MFCPLPTVCSPSVLLVVDADLSSKLQCLSGLQV